MYLLIGSFASAVLLMSQVTAQTALESAQQAACCYAAPAKQDTVVKESTPVTAATAACCLPATPARDIARDDSGDPSTDAACASGLRMKMFVTEFEQSPVESARSQLAKALEVMKGVFRASASEDGRLLTVLAEADSDVTAERVLKYLELAGYKATEASKADYEAEIVRQGGIRAGPVEKKAEVALAVVADTTSTAGGDKPPDGRALRVDGITSQACVDSIAEALAPIDGVDSVQGSAENKIVWVGFKPDATVSDERLLKAVKTAGFDATVLDNVMVRSASSSGGANDAPACGIRINPKPVTPVAGDQAEESTNGERYEEAVPGLVSLDDSLKPLIDAFNADKGKLRFVTILSPT